MLIGGSVSEKPAAPLDFACSDQSTTWGLPKGPHVKAWVATTVGLLRAVASGCGSASNIANCPDAIDVTFLNATAWKPGSYAFTLGHGEERKTCTVQLVTTAEGGAGGAHAGCSSGTFQVTVGEQAVVTNAAAYETFELLSARDGRKFFERVFEQRRARAAWLARHTEEVAQASILAARAAVDSPSSPRVRLR